MKIKAEIFPYFEILYVKTNPIFINIIAKSECPKNQNKTSKKKHPFK